jgi:hypothetical protein
MTAIATPFRPAPILWVPGAAVLLALCVGMARPALLQAQVKAQVAAGAAPAWNKGILPISPESYWNAVECGKQGGENPPCVFYDTGLCKNDDFVLAMYTPYKMVAYEVWRVVRQGQPAPTPSYPEAQRTRVTVGVTPVRGSKNVISSVVVRRGGTTIKPGTQSIDETGGRFTFDHAAFAATGDLTLDLVGKARTISCLIEQPVLTLFR